MSVILASEREFGELTERVKNLREAVDDTRSDVAIIDGKVDGILSRFDQATGGLRVAMAVSGFLGAAAMLVLTKVLPLLFSGLPRI